MRSTAACRCWASTASRLSRTVSSKAKAIKNALRVARQAAIARLPEAIAEGVRLLNVPASATTTSNDLS